MSQRRRSSLFPWAEAKAIPVSKWGISKSHFIEFVNEVNSYQKKGLIKNDHLPYPLPSDDAGDLFDKQGNERIVDFVPKTYQYSDIKFNDPNIGPTIFQITEQIVKPLVENNGTLPGLSGAASHPEAIKARRKTIAAIGDGFGLTSTTAAAAATTATNTTKRSSTGTSLSEALPKSSWALLKNPSGLDIDLFVAHSWAAGIYEFASHLLKEWPDDCNGAYICFLSNPPNLDRKLYSASGNLQDNIFYKVLQIKQMKQMVMISTQNAPIHRRAWCCFEAYVAMKQGLPITIGGDKKYLSAMRKRVRDCKKTNKQLERHTQQLMQGDHQDRYQRHKVIVQSMTDLVALIVVCYATIAACLLVPIILVEDRLPSEFVAPFKSLFNFICNVASMMLFPVIYLSKFCWWCIQSWSLKPVDETLHKAEAAEHELHEVKRSAVDVRLAQASMELDKATILRVIGEDADTFNEMLTNLILNKVTISYGTPMGAEISFVTN